MMSTERLKTLRKQEQKQRKFVCVMNEVAKNQQERYGNILEKEKHESAQNSDKDIVHTRRNIVRQRVLKKCLRQHREDVEKQQAKRMLGKYHGESIENIAGQIDGYLESHHPRVRRRQKIEELFQDGYEHGALLDDDTIRDKVRNYFSKPLVHVQHFDTFNETNKATSVKREQIETHFKPSQETFYTGNFQQTDGQTDQKRCGTVEVTKKLITKDKTERESDKLFVSRQKCEDFIIEDTSDSMSVQSESIANRHFISGKTDLRPITLPPIKIGTDNYTPKPAEKKDCISELVDRIHKAKENREKEMKIRKEKRAKRLQAERVRDYYGHKEEVLTEQAHSDWDAYEERKDELLASIANTKGAIEDRLHAGREIELREQRFTLPPLNQRCLTKGSRDFQTIKQN